MVKTDLLSTSDLVDMCRIMKINLIECVGKSYLRTPPPRGQPSCYIINLDDTNGTHWTCFFVSSHKEAVYMDSYGQLPPSNVIQFFKKNGISWIYSPIQVQDYDSVMCGYFCVYFLYYMTQFCKTQSQNLRFFMHKILDIFNDDDQKGNDEILHKKMSEILKKYFSF